MGQPTRPSIYLIQVVAICTHFVYFWLKFMEGEVKIEISVIHLIH